MTDTKRNLQNLFLDHLIKHKIASTVFLANGVKLQGVITSSDDTSLLLRREDHVQLVYKNAISTIMPNASIQFFEGEVTEGDGA